jgi:cytoskeletal protein CcmA (bactofilin family)
VTGSVTAREKVYIRATGSLNGDVIAPHIALVDGGYFCGSVTEQSSGE